MLTYRGIPSGWGAGWAVTRKQGVGYGFEKPKKRAKLQCSNREASIGYLAYMVNRAYIRRYIVYSMLDAEQSGKL